MDKFLELKQESQTALGEFWDEEYKSIFVNHALSRYTTDVIRVWTISDFVFMNDKVLLKWVRRYEPLTDDELKEKWGRTDFKKKKK